MRCSLCLLRQGKGGDGLQNMWHRMESVTDGSRGTGHEGGSSGSRLESTGISTSRRPALRFAR